MLQITSSLLQYYYYRNKNKIIIDRTEIQYCDYMSFFTRSAQPLTIGEIHYFKLIAFQSKRKRKYDLPQVEISLGLVYTKLGYVPQN